MSGEMQRREQLKHAFLVFWIMCGVFNRGYLLGGFTMEFPAYRHDVGTAMFSLAGPFALPESIFYAASGAPYMWKGYTCQQRWDAWDSKELGQNWFVHNDGNFDCKNFVPKT